MKAGPKHASTDSTALQVAGGLAVGVKRRLPYIDAMSLLSGHFPKCGDPIFCRLNHA